MKRLLILPLVALLLAMFAPVAHAGPPVQTAQGGSDCQAGNPEIGDPLTAVSFPEDGSARDQWYELSFDSGTKTLESLVADDDPLWTFRVTVYAWDGGSECPEIVQRFHRDTIRFEQLAGIVEGELPGPNEPLPAGQYQVEISSGIFFPGDGGEVALLALPGA